MSNFSGIEIGKRGLIAQRLNMTTVGHNINNMNREGYTKQRVVLSSAMPLHITPLGSSKEQAIGQGVSVAQVERIKNRFLEHQIDGSLSSEHYWGTRKDQLLRLETVFNEVDAGSLRDVLDAFWNSWQDLARNPESLAARQVVKEQALNLATRISTRSSQLVTLQKQFNTEIAQQTQTINTLLSQLQTVQTKIQIEQSKGANPNDLLDKRDVLTRELSQFLRLEVEEGPTPDRYQIYLEGQHLMQGTQVKPLSLEQDLGNEGFFNPRWADSRENFPLNSGTLTALLELRDGDVRTELKELNKLAATFADVLNTIHQEAYGLDGNTGRDFFRWTPVRSTDQGFYDSDNDGVDDSVYLFRIRGQNILSKDTFIGQAGQMVLPGSEGPIVFDYAANETVGSLLQRLNQAGSDLAFSLDHQNRLNIRAHPSFAGNNPDFVIRSLEDNGVFLSTLAGVLQGSGPQNSFDYQDLTSLANLAPGTDTALTPNLGGAIHLEFNQELAVDLSKIAAGFSEFGRSFPGNNQAALAVASLRTSEIFIGKDRNFDDYLARSIASVGAKTEVAIEQHAAQEIYLQALFAEQEAQEGVSLDAELADMIQFRNAYAAVAKFITHYDALLETLINVV